MDLDFLNDLGKKTQAVASVAADKAKDAVESAKISMSIAGEQRDMEKIYRAIGEWYVSEYSGEIPSAVKDLVDSIMASKAKIAELESSKPCKETNEAPPAQPVAKTCPICGAVSDSKFCPQCGAPMGE